MALLFKLFVGMTVELHDRTVRAPRPDKVSSKLAKQGKAVVQLFDEFINVEDVSAQPADI